MLKERVERKLEASGRVTPREVLAAYEVTGFEPVAGHWGHWERKEACAFTALGYAVGIRRDFPSSVGRAYWKYWSNLDEDYAGGFVSGFDGSYCTRPSERKGWIDGRRAARFVFGAAA